MNLCQPCDESEEDNDNYYIKDDKVRDKNTQLLHLNPIIIHTSIKALGFDHDE